jgi:long-chain acyl-CoA synthetase
LHLELAVACAEIGAVYTPVTNLAGWIVMKQLIELVEARIIFFHPSLSQQIDHIREKFPSKEYIMIPDDPIPKSIDGYHSLKELMDQNKDFESLPNISIDENDTAWRLSTSGTTGTPKAVELTYENLSYALLCIPFHPETCYIHFSQLFHISSIFMFNTFKYGGKVILLKSFNLDEYLTHCSNNQQIYCFLPPAILKQILNHSKNSETDRQQVKEGFKNVRKIIYGTVSIETSILSDCVNLFPHIQFLASYGLTETTGPIAFLPHDDHIRGLNGHPHLLQSCGKPTLHHDVKIVGDDKKPLPPGKQGMILLKGTMVCKTYYKNETAWTDAILEGYFISGDIGKMDEEGYVYILGREKEQIKPGEILPNLLNNNLATCPDILDSVCMGIPLSFYDPSAHPLHSQLESFVVRKTSKLTEEDLRKFLVEMGVAPHYMPLKIHFLKSIPKNAIGKPDIVGIRQSYISNKSKLEFDITIQ